ncbi:hypothetical protein M8C21_013601, partial [Ambrosia artemisiifolia]
LPEPKSCEDREQEVSISLKRGHHIRLYAGEEGEQGGKNGGWFTRRRWDAVCFRVDLRRRCGEVGRWQLRGSAVVFSTLRLVADDDGYNTMKTDYLQPYYMSGHTNWATWFPGDELMVMTTVSILLYMFIYCCLNFFPVY